MPLDRLPPAPAPTVPSPKRAPRAVETHAPAFKLPQAETKTTQAAAARAETTERQNAKARQDRERDAESNRAQDASQQDQTRQADAQRPQGAEAALSLNDAFAQALGEDQGEAAESAVAAQTPETDAQSAPAASAPLDTDTVPSGADMSQTTRTEARDAAPMGASTTAPSQAAQNDAAPQQTLAIKPDAGAKASSQAGEGWKAPQPAPQPTAPEAGNDSAAAPEAAPIEAELTPEASAPVSDAESNVQAAQDEDAALIGKTDRPARDVQAERPDARAVDAPSAGKDSAVKAEADPAQSRSTPEQRPAAQANAETAPASSDQRSAQPQTPGQTQGQGQTQSASVGNEQAQTSAAQQAAFNQAQHDKPRVETDRAPGVQAKARQADKSDAASKSPAPQGAADAAVTRSAGADASAVTRAAQTPTASTAAAPADPLAWLLQDTLAGADAPIEVPAETVDAELDLGMMRQHDVRTEAARPTPHPQAHAASRFAPTTVHTLAAQITRKFNDGGRVFDIRLDPPELGRVEVRLELGPNNKVSAILSAERADTLSELQRSARDLEKALTDAGLELGEDGLSFSLSEDNGAFSGFEDRTGGSADGFSARNRFTLEVETDLPGAPLADALYGFAVSQRAGVNLIA